MEWLLVIAVVIAAIGAINWGLIGLFGLDLVGLIAGGLPFGETNTVSRTIYVLVGIAGVISLWAIFEILGDTA